MCASKAGSIGVREGNDSGFSGAALGKAFTRANVRIYGPLFVPEERGEPLGQGFAIEQGRGSWSWWRKLTTLS